VLKNSPINLIWLRVNFSCFCNENLLEGVSFWMTYRQFKATRWQYRKTFLKIISSTVSGQGKDVRIFFNSEDEWIHWRWQQSLKSSYLIVWPILHLYQQVSCIWICSKWTRRFNVMLQRMNWKLRIPKWNSQLIIFSDHNIISAGSNGRAI